MLKSEMNVCTMAETNSHDTSEGAKDEKNMKYYFLMIN